MRWERLFGDLEAQLDEAERGELAAEVADRARAEAGRLRLVDRLRAARGHEVAVGLPAVGMLRGVLREAGPDWLLVADAHGREALVPASAVASVAGLGARSAEPGTEGQVAARLDLRHALRGLARDRAPVAAVLADGTTVSGTVDRVGADFVEVAEHPAAEPRRAAAVRAVRVVPLAALVVVRSA